MTNKTTTTSTTSRGQYIEFSQQLWFNKDGNGADIHFITVHVGYGEGAFGTLTLLFLYDGKNNNSSFTQEDNCQISQQLKSR